MITLNIHGKVVDVYPSDEPDKPVIYLNTFGHEGKKVYQELQKMNSPAFNMVAISKLSWDSEMSPWDCPPISKTDFPCTGGADEFLSMMIEDILPKAEENIKGTPVWRGITGYSLAGLFAVYSIYQTDLFTRVASMSGSLWFPGLTDYIYTHDFKVQPEHVYFSLGDKESKTKNSYLCTTQEKTSEIQAYYDKKGIDCVFVLNPGNHYVNGDKRTAAGLDWILRR